MFASLFNHKKFNTMAHLEFHLISLAIIGLLSFAATFGTIWYFDILDYIEFKGMSAFKLQIQKVAFFTLPFLGAIVLVITSIY
mgnify:CR=1 FL=1